MWARVEGSCRLHVQLLTSARRVKCCSKNPNLDTIDADRVEIIHIGSEPIIVFSALSSFEVARENAVYQHVLGAIPTGID